MPNNIFKKLEKSHKKNDKKLVKENLIALTDLARGGDSRTVSFGASLHSGYRYFAR